MPLKLLVQNVKYDHNTPQVKTSSEHLLLELRNVKMHLTNSIKRITCGDQKVSSAQQALSEVIIVTLTASFVYRQFLKLVSLLEKFNETK